MPFLLLLAFGVVRPGTDSVLGESEAVFLGSLLDRDSFWSQDGRFIWTRNVFKVEEGLKGGALDTVEIFELGGTVGEVSLRVSHPVDYEFGQTYLVFARRDESGRLRTWGGLEGRSRLVEDGAGRRLLRVRARGALSALLGEPSGVLQEWDEIRTRLKHVWPGTGENR